MRNKQSKKLNFKTFSAAFKFYRLNFEEWILPKVIKAICEFCDVKIKYPKVSMKQQQNELRENGVLNFVAKNNTPTNARRAQLFGGKHFNL